MPPKSADPRDRMFFFEAAPQPCIVLGQDLRIRDVNYAFTALTGWSLDDVSHRGVHELMGAGAVAALQRVLCAPDWGRVHRIQARFPCRVGDSVQLDWHVRALPARQKIYCMAAPAALQSAPQALPPATPVEARPVIMVPARSGGAPSWARRQAPIQAK